MHPERIPKESRRDKSTRSSLAMLQIRAFSSYHDKVIDVKKSNMLMSITILIIYIYHLFSVILRHRVKYE